MPIAAIDDPDRDRPAVALGLEIDGATPLLRVLVGVVEEVVDDAAEQAPDRRRSKAILAAARVEGRSGWEARNFRSIS
jgi:hypothetical protein